MKNLVDLHAHVLPGLDDGPEDLTGSLEMLEALQEMGFEHIFATPHQRLYAWEGLDAGTVEDSVRKVKGAALSRGIGVNILPGMEFDLDETLPERSAVVPGGAGHLLVDAGFWGVPRDLPGLLGTLKEQGAEVFLVHPERNQDLCRHREVLSGLAVSGVRLLGNLGSLSGMYGPDVRREALALLRDGLYWALASDMHSAEQSRWIRSGIRKLVTLVGDQAAGEMLVERPMDVVRAMEGHL